MKKIIYLVLLVFIGNVSFAQDEPTYGIGTPTENEKEVVETENGVVVEFNLGENDPDSNIQKQFFTLGLGVNPVLSNGKFNLPNTNSYNDWDLKTMKSTNVNLGLAHFKLNVLDKKFFLHTGLDLDMKKFAFEENFIINKESEIWNSYAFTANTKKNKLGATYLELPVMINYESDTVKAKSFSVNAGAYAGLRLGSRQKIKFKDKEDNIFSGKEKKKYKETDPFNLNNFTYGIEGTVGYGGLSLYTKYSLQDLFEEKAGNPELTPLTIGVLLTPF